MVFDGHVGRGAARGRVVGFEQGARGGSRVAVAAGDSPGLRGGCEFAGGRTT